MSEIIIAYCLGIITTPIMQFFVFPYAKKKIRERWNDEENEHSEKKRGRGRPLGSKNKKKEEKEE